MRTAKLVKTLNKNYESIYGDIVLLCHTFQLSEPMEDFPNTDFICISEYNSNIGVTLIENKTVSIFLIDKDIVLPVPILFRQPGTVDGVLTELGYTGIGDY